MLLRSRGTCVCHSLSLLKHCYGLIYFKEVGKKWAHLFMFYFTTVSCSDQKDSYCAIVFVCPLTTGTKCLLYTDFVYEVTVLYECEGVCVCVCVYVCVCSL